MAHYMHASYFHYDAKTTTYKRKSHGLVARLSTEAKQHAPRKTSLEDIFIQHAQTLSHPRRLLLPNERNKYATSNIDKSIPRRPVMGSVAYKE